MEIEVKPSSVDQIPPALSDPAGSVLRPDQVADHLHQIRLTQAQLEDPRVQDKGGVRKRLQDVKRQFDMQAPRQITDGSLKDKLVKKSKDLLEKILPGMVSEEEMRKNPAGTVDRHMRWERGVKKDILEWKKIQRCLQNDGSDPLTWDRDAANIERYRPQGAADRMRTDAQIGGHMSYGNVPQGKWDSVFPNKPDSALEQAKRVADEKGKKKE